MKPWTALVAAVVVVPLPVAAQQTVTLDNGDRLHGQLTGIAGDTWTVRYRGVDVSIPVGEVASLAAPTLIGVRLADGTIAAVTIEAADTGLVLRLADGSTRIARPADLAAVGSADKLSALRPIHVGLFSPITKFWRASGSLGFSDKSGNSRARGLTTGLDLERRSPNDRLRLSAGLTREESRGATGAFEPTVAKSFAALRADVYVTSRLFTFAETRQERDTFQDLSLRSSYGGGLGVQLIQTAVTDLRVSLSGGVRVENYLPDSLATQTAAVARPGFTLQQDMGPVTFSWDAAVDGNVEDAHDFRVRSEAALVTTVFKGLGFRIGMLNEYDNTPQPGIEKHDTLVTATLAYSVGK